MGWGSSRIMLTDESDADYKWDETGSAAQRSWSIVVTDALMTVEKCCVNVALSGQGYLKGLIAALGWNWRTGITKHQASAKRTYEHWHPARTHWECDTFHLVPRMLSSRSLADVSSFHAFLCAFIHQPPSSCLRHLCSDITCDIRQDLWGDPCSQANIGWLSKASATATQWRKNSFASCAWPRNEA